MNDLRRALRPALWTALWAFLGPVLLMLAGVVQDVAEWASTSGRAPLPGLSSLGFALVAAACSAASGLIAFVVRYAQAKGLVAGEPPAYQPGERVPAEAGHADITTVCLVVIAVVFVLWAAGVVPR